MKQVYLIFAAMMLLCLAPMPYGYYMLVRFAATVVFCLMAYRYYMNDKAIAAVVFTVLALLFQPFYKIALGRGLWNVIDVMVAILLVGLFVLERRLARKATDCKQIPPQDRAALEGNEMAFSAEGRLEADELLYVANEEDKELTELFETRPKVLEGWGQMIGYHIVYLPLLIKRLKDKRVLRYRMPYLSDAEIAQTAVLLPEQGCLQGRNDFLLQYLEHPSDREKIRQGFLRTENVYQGSDGKDKAANRFYPLSSKSDEPLADQLHRIGKQIAAEQAGSGRYIEGVPTPPDERGGEDDGCASTEGLADDGYASTEGLTDDGYASTEGLMEEVRERVARLRQRGIAEHILEQLIHPDNRLSRMVVTKDWRIVLPDYNDMEIRMEPLVKAVYVLFLKHPEGIAFKRLPDYREELTMIYEQLRPAGLTERTLQSIDDVTNPMRNSINEKCARIRAAFVGQFDDYMAKSYYIDGARGEPKRIALPRDLVEWQ